MHSMPFTQRRSRLALAITNLVLLGFGMLPSGRTLAQQYKAVLLDAAGYFDSTAVSINDGKVAGWGGALQAAWLWDAHTGSGHNLNPVGFTSSGVFAISGDWQVGMGYTPSTFYHALLWNSDPVSMVDLNPTGFDGSGARGIHDKQVVGWGQRIGKYVHALLWSDGTADSYRDLHPAKTEFIDSIAFGTDGVQQVGYGDSLFTQTEHALLWAGSAETVVDLGEGVAKGVKNGEQVGVSGQHAMLWHGTAESAVRLTPPGFYQSDANATNGRQQAGWGGLGYDPDTGFLDSIHALVWSGSAEQYVDLHPFVPAGYRYSIATGIDANGDVVGNVFNYYGDSHAILWHLQTVPEPGTSAVLCAASLPLLGLLGTRRTRRRHAICAKS